MSLKSFEFSLPPSFVETQNGIRIFQEDMNNFLDNSNNILLLDAPTGAGKTRGFFSMDRLGKVVIVLPTNILAQQVYEDLIKECKSAILLNKSFIDKMFDDGGYKGYSNKLELIKEMTTLNSFLVTNPTVFLYLILNYYGHGNSSIKDYESDFAIFLYKQGFRVIIIDEFHLFSTDQIRIILAINTILRKNFKFVYSSATPTETMKNALNDLSKDLSLRIQEIKVERKKEGEGNPIQGPMHVKIYLEDGYNVFNFLETNGDLLKNGNWTIIADRITEIEKIYKRILEGDIDLKEIMLLDGYHYNEKTVNFDKRIIIASNVLEQGINLPNKYSNILMDSGHSIKNLAQRLGRVGRGTSTMSKVYICIPKEVSNEAIKNISSYDELIENLSYILPDQLSGVSLYSIGVFLGAIASKMRSDTQKIIKKSLEESRIIDGIRDFESVNYFLSPNNNDLKQKMLRYPYIDKVSKWWQDYKNSFYTFIEQEPKENVIDISLGPDQIFDAEYNFLWIKSNKELLNIYEGPEIAYSTKDRPDRDFSIRVKGIPFINEKTYRYGDILYDSRNLIIEELKHELKNTDIILDQTFERIFRKVEKIVKMTAGKGRLTIIG